MPSPSRNLPRLLVVAHALGGWRERVVFVDGVTVNLYSTAPGVTPEPRRSGPDLADCLAALQAGLAAA